jgi:hypothetical protein
VGTATFLDGATTLASSTLTNGQVAFGTAGLGVGSHGITASYGGSAGFAASTSAPLVQTVNQAATQTTLTASANPVSPGQTVTFTATVSPVSPGSGTPGGVVTFLDGTTTLGTGPVISGQGTFPTATLSPGSHSITASYGGDPNFTGSTSAAVIEQVVASPLVISVSESIKVTDTPLVPSMFINVSEAIKVTDTPAIYNTPGGSNIVVQPVDTTTGTSPVKLTFTTVTQPGVTSLTTGSGGPPPPAGFQLGTPAMYYNLTTTAGYTGPIQICINYAGISFQTPPGPRLFHFQNGNWADVTTSVDTTSMIVCGSSSSLSPFALFQSAQSFGIATTTAISAPGVAYGTPAVAMVSVGSASFSTQGSFLASSAAGSLLVTQAPLTISANNASRPYGANNPVLTGTIAGLRNADPITANFATTAVPASPAGADPITPVVLDPQNRLSNYKVTLVSGTLAVVPEVTSLGVTISPSSIPVGQSTTITVTLIGPDMVIPIDPAVLAPVTVTSPVVSDILTNNGVCTPVPGAVPGIATCSMTLTAVEPNGRTLGASFPGARRVLPR